MSDFASILERVQREAVERSTLRPIAPRWRASGFATDELRVQNARDAQCAYSAESARVQPETAPSPDARRLRRAIAAAGDDATKLRALRRHAARALHPDRGGDGALLAECNALIDAALRISRRRT